MTDDAKYTATLKAGAGYDAPWLVVRADTPDEMVQALRDAYSTLSAPLAATAQVLQAEWSGSVPAAPAPHANNHGFQQQPSAGHANSAQGMASSQPASTAAPQAGGNTEEDRWGGTYEHNHPQAPATPWGPKVLKRATSQAGKRYAQWIDPRDPKIPSVYKANGKDKPADLLGAEFANGV